MHRDEKFIEARARRILTQKLPTALYPDSFDLDISAWEVPGEPVPFSDALTASYQPFAPGTRWGKPWGTTWFKVEGSVPKDWKLSSNQQLELEVDLGFTGANPGFQAEALIWSPTGRILKALEPRNRALRLQIEPGTATVFYLEAASNPDVARDWSFRKTEMGHKSTAGADFQYQLKHVRISILDLEVWNYSHDLEILLGLAQQLSSDSPRRSMIIRSIENSLDQLDLQGINATVSAARKTLAPVLASPAHASAHTVHAVGHAHIDTAWLWPLRETRRKVARTFSNALDLIEQSDEFIFAASSAQQYKWIKDDYPELFERIRSAVKKGRFVPIGGMWIEPDANVPSGESLTRQLLEGKKFFMDEFGVEPKDVWLPDSFGYSGALPQIVVASGSCWFLSQKLSWSDTNLFPHHSFMWEGIDGTQVFTHFPPADTYNAMISPAELKKAESSFLEKGRANISLLPFGWGNGGGGPTRDMVAAGMRQRNLEGSAKVVFSNPERFFESARAEYSNPPVWVGELYLEFHRGTATTQAPIKRGNRLAERLMREVELWWSTAVIQSGAAYPADEIRSLWHDVLLLQFHDILPGTSIQWVHEEAAALHQSIQVRAESLIDEAAKKVLGNGSSTVELNAGPFALNGIAPLAGGVAKPAAPIKVEQTENEISLTSQALRVTINGNGNIASIFDLRVNRELIPTDQVANLLQLHSDFPSVWDAWDIDRSYLNTVTDITSVANIEVIEEGATPTVRVTRKFGASAAIQELSISSDGSSLLIGLEVDWQESEKFLKLAFPVAIQTWKANSEIQYGHLERAIHKNTSWDAARFETLAHRWVHVGEPNYGVALANDATYGHDITRGRTESENYTTIRASVLRAPNFPDPTSDRGRHRFNYLLKVGADIPGAIETGYELNVPLRKVDGVAKTFLDPLLEVDPQSVVIEAVKIAEDGSGDLIVRAYESQGIRSRLQLKPNFNCLGAELTDTLERSLGENLAIEAGHLTIEFGPFQLRTIRVRR